MITDDSREELWYENMVMRLLQNDGSFGDKCWKLGNMAMD